LPVLPEFIGERRLVVHEVTEGQAQEALNAQLAKSHRDARNALLQQLDAHAELDALISGTKSSFSGRKMGHYSHLFPTSGVLDNAAFNLEKALLTNNFEDWADYSEVEPVNIPRQFQRGDKPGLPPQPRASPAGYDDSQVRLPCGL
jgi:hypothetical protein